MFILWSFFTWTATGKGFYFDYARVLFDDWFPVFSLGGQGRAEGPAHCPLQGRRNIWEHWGYDRYIIVIPIWAAGANYAIECTYLIWKCSAGPFAAQSHPLAQGPACSQQLVSSTSMLLRLHKGLQGSDNGHCYLIFLADDKRLFNLFKLYNLAKNSSCVEMDFLEFCRMILEILGME